MQRKWFVALFVALSLLAVTGWEAQAADFPQPGDMITKENMAQAKSVLSPTAEWMLREGMVMKVVPYRKYEWPKAYKEATEKYSGQVKLTADGKDLHNYVAGAPFPNIDINDPMAGFKVKWNHEYFPCYTDNVG